MTLYNFFVSFLEARGLAMGEIRVTSSSYDSSCVSASSAWSIPFFTAGDFMFVLFNSSVVLSTCSTAACLRYVCSDHARHEARVVRPEQFMPAQAAWLDQRLRSIERDPSMPHNCGASITVGVN